MGILSCSPLTTVEAPVDVFLSSSTRLFTVSSELYLVGAGDFPNKRATNPIGVYKVGFISLSYNGSIFYQSWFEIINQGFGVFCTDYESEMPIFCYLDLYGSGLQNASGSVNKGDSGSFGYAPDDSGTFFFVAFGGSSDPENPPIGNPTRMVAKVKPGLLGWLKPCDKVIVTNISSNVQIDVSIDSLR